ncbi:MAG: O-methyltransferase [Erysipelotrichaceae bacterium]|nr:O-methyltransferase [Erysipelotrichaceae bacterium]
MYFPNILLKMIDSIKKFAKENNVPIMLDDGISFLINYIKEKEIKNILEVGSAIGFSAIMMATVSNDIIVDTIEIDTGRFEIAKKNIKSFNLDSRINIYNTDALEFVSEKKYDLIFIDAAKAQYKRYMEYFLNNLKDDGVFIFDNMNFHGMVDNFESIKNRNTRSLVKKIKRFKDEILDDENYEVIFEKNIGDGIIIAKYKRYV